MGSEAIIVPQEIESILFVSIPTKRDATGLPRGVSRSLLYEGKAKMKEMPRAGPVDSHVIATASADESW